MTGDILVLDRDQKDLAVCERDLISLGYHPIVTADLENAQRMLKSQKLALLLTDILSLAGCESELLRAAHDTDPQIAVVVLTGVANLEAAVQTLKKRALFYLVKPVSLDQLKVALERAVITASSNGGQKRGWEPRPHDIPGESIIGASPVMRQVVEIAGRVAMSNANIVLFGESGTGKELFARTIHACSTRSAGPFVPVDCASLPENLLEAELFGFERGAFTGATHTKTGLMELANLGTLFFDEVAELPLSLQPKLLRALQERKHRRLGGTKIVSFDVRVIAATNRDLNRLVIEGKFRQDLFYRLNVVRIHLPPLRQRENDVILLANHLLSEHKLKTPSGPEHFAPEVLQLFEQYSWPGNVRELQNVVEYCCALTRGNVITLQDLPEELQLFSPAALEITPSLPIQAFKVAKARALAQFEAVYVSGLLKGCGNNISQAAKAAGIDRKTFYSLLQKHHLHR